MMNCKKCNAVNEEDSLVCRWCGAEIEPSDNKTNKNKSSNHKKRNRMLILIFTAVILLSCLAVILIPRLSASLIGGGKQHGIKSTNYDENNNVQSPSDLVFNQISPTPTPTTTNTNTTKQLPSFLYMKEGKVYNVGMENLKPKGIINNLYTSNGITDSILVSEDGTRLFYPLNHEEQAVGVTIFTYNLASKVEERSRIDTNITRYAINQDGTRMYYIKDDNTLYVSDLTKSEKIQEGVNVAYINQTGDRVVYSAGGIYQKNYGQEIQLIAEDASLQYVSRDLNTIYYIQNQTLYLMKNGAEIKKIDSGVSSFTFLYDTGTIYYQKDSTMTSADFVDDDKAVSDAAMKEPKRKDYPNDKSFLKDDLLYKQKLVRDQLRQDSKIMSLDGTWYSLYCYSEGKSKLISDCCNYVWGAENLNQKMLYARYTGYGKPYLVYSHLKYKNIGKIKLSMISSLDDINRFIINKMEQNQEFYMCLGSEKIKKIGNGNLSGFVFDTKEKGFYYTVSPKDESDKSDLYYSSLKGDSVSEGKKLAENINQYISLPQTETLVYIKNINKEHSRGDLYVDNKKIDSDVNSIIKEWKEGNSFLYTKNTTNNYDSYTLMIYQDGSGKKIADKVTSYKQLDSTTIIYTAEDLSKENKINLYLYDGSDNRILIDTDVDKIIEPSINDHFTMDAIYGFNY